MAESSSNVRPVNTTPPSSRVAAPPSTVSGTPHNRGSSSRMLRNDPDGAKEPNIFNVPSDWRSEGHEYQKIIKTISANEEFRILRNNYLALCDTDKTLEYALYKPQTSLYNHAITLINENCEKSHYKEPHLLLHFRVNHPNRFTTGIFNGQSGLSPDLTGIFKVLEHQKSFVWPMIVHVEEMKNTKSTLDTGEDAPRAANKGEGDPLSTKYSLARKRALAETEAQPTVPSNKRRKSPMTSAPSKSARTSHQQSGPTRPDEESVVPTTNNDKSKTKDDEIQSIAKTRLQCARYLMEMLEYSILRSHATLTLVDRDQMQLMYADRSVIVTSSIVDLREDDGFKMFLAMLIAFHRLTPEQWGFLPLVDRSFPCKIQEKTPTTAGKHGLLKGSIMQVQRKGAERPTSLTLGDVIYHQAGIIGRGTCVVRAACKAPEEWKGQNLVVKVSWPSAERVSEIELLELARDTAEKLLEKRKQKAKTLKEEAQKLLNAGDANGAKTVLDTAENLVEGDQKHWVLKHLPNILHSQDIDLESDTNPMPQTKLAHFFGSAEFFGGDFKYEPRALRTNVQEELQKLTNLSRDRQYAQAFYDVLLCHRWLHEYPRVLHRDISAGNIMYRIIAGEAYGVLNDFDLSSRRETVEQGIPTFRQRTGTPPYMAVELLSDSSPIRHLYRHDLESLTYVILLHCSRYQLNSHGQSSKRLDKPSGFEDWFNPDLTWDSLKDKKSSFWSQSHNYASHIHQSFEAFVPWIRILLTSFRHGFRAKAAWQDREDSIEIFGATPQKEEEGASDAVTRNLLGVDTEPPLKVAIQPANFDDETLGGYTSYGRLAFSLWKFKDRKLNFRDKDGHLQTGVPGEITMVGS